MLRDKGYLVKNVYLVYTLQQTIWQCKLATYVCPLVGRLQDQGHDALALVEQCVNAVDLYVTIQKYVLILFVMLNTCVMLLMLAFTQSLFH